MPDLNQYKEVVQLSEDVEYPDGYNCVEITGTGDEKTVKVFPTLTITGPATISSDGTTVATIAVTIYDPNSTDPFYLDPDQFEEASLDGPQDLSTTYWITSQPKVFEDEAMTKEVPTTFIEYKENTIHIKDGWAGEDAPGGWNGFYKRQAWVLYDGQKTLSVEDGKQTVEEWWIKGGDDESETEEDVSGIIYIDQAATEECESSEIGIPNIKGQTVTVYFYYRPDAGEEGIAYINAEWDDSPVEWPISVKMGSYEGCSVQIDADPSSVVPSTGESLITFTAANKDGGPLTSATVTFYLQSGNGTLSPSTASLSENKDCEEEVESSTKTEFSVSNPVIRVTSITAIGGGFTWNNQITIDGSSLTLVNQEFANNVTPLTVKYDWGGKGTTTYKATGTVDGDKIYIGGTLGAGVNALCTVDIDKDADTGGDGDESLTISADPSTIARSGESTITCECTDKDGKGVTSGISYTLTPNKGTLTMKGSSAAITDSSASISDSKTISVNHPIKSITSIEYNGDNYTAASFDGSTITITGDFGVYSGTGTVVYIPDGVSVGTYKAIDEDYVVAITGKYSSVGDTCEVTVGTGDEDTDVTLTASADPSSITTKSGENKSTVTAKLDKGGALVGKTVSFDVASGPGTVNPKTATTDANGEAKVEYSASSAGTGKINVTYDTLSTTVSITVTKDPGEEEEEEETMTLPAVNYVGEADPATKEFTLSGGGTIADWGIAEECDGFGGYSGDPANTSYGDGYLMIYCSNNEAMAWDIVSVAVSGGTFELSSMQKLDPFFLDSIEVGIQWPYELNKAREQNISVTDKVDGNPVVGAKVTIAGQTVTTDSTGTAKFKDLSGGTYTIDITHPNYKDNHAGVAGGVGVYDTDTSNDKYTVGDYSPATWLLKKVDINISVTYTVKKSKFYEGYGP